MSLQFFVGLVQMFDDIAGQHSLFSKLFCCTVSGKGMKPGAEDGGNEVWVALCQKSGDDARQHVTASRGSHATVAIGASYGIAHGGADDGRMAFQDDIHLMGLGIGEGGLQTFLCILAGMGKTIKLAYVRSQDAVGWYQCLQGWILRDEVDGIGIQYQGQDAALQVVSESMGSLG